VYIILITIIAEQTQNRATKHEDQLSHCLRMVPRCRCQSLDNNLNIVSNC